MARCSVCGSKECCGGELEQERDQLQARCAELTKALNEAMGWNWIDHESLLEDGEESDLQEIADELIGVLNRTAAQSLAALEARVLRDERDRIAGIIFQALEQYGKHKNKDCAIGAMGGLMTGLKQLVKEADRIEAKAKGDV